MRVRHFVANMMIAFAIAAAPEGESLPAPKPNQPWEHEATGLRLPDRLAGMTAEDVYRYPEAVLGFSARYTDNKARLRGDVYVYPCQTRAESASEILEAARHSASRAVWEVEEMQRRGSYKDVKVGEATYKAFDLIPKEEGASGLLSLSMQYVISERSEAGDSETKVGSFLGIMLLSNHLVKVRVTHPLDEKAAMAKRVTEFVNAVRRCVLDPGLRKQTADQIEAYRLDRFSEAGHDLAGGILSYAQVTPLITLTTDDTISTLGDEVEKDYPEASLELLRAFIVGAVAESLKKPGAVPADLPQAGAEEMLRAFEAMSKIRPGLASPRMRALGAAVQDKKAAAWLREQEKQRNR